MRPLLVSPVLSEKIESKQKTCLLNISCHGESNSLYLAVSHRIYCWDSVGGGVEVYSSARLSHAAASCAPREEQCHWTSSVFRRHCHVKVANSLLINPGMVCCGRIAYGRPT
ncbi:hypothetical protein MRX96_021628 [Rhipicephalus microplus]